MDPEIRERMAAVETELKNVKIRQSEIADKVDDIHAVINKSRGGFWVLITLISLLGAGLANKVLRAFYN